MPINTDNVPFVFTTEFIDTKDARRCLNALVDRHDVLRSNIVYRSGVPMQEINSGTKYDIITVVADDCIHGQKSLLVGQLCGTPFDLNAGPWARFGFVQHPGKRTVLVVVIHHIACDAQSSRILAAEWAALCNAATCTDDCIVGGELCEAAGLQARRLKFSDYTIRHRELLEFVSGPQQNYWRKRLGDSGTAVSLVKSHVLPYSIK